MRKDVRIFILFLCVGACFIAVESYGEAKAHRISLSVKEKIVRNRDRTPAGNAVVTVDTETQICTLEIEVMNDAEYNDVFQLEWCFISKETFPGGDGDLRILNSKVIPVALGAGESFVKKAVSAPFVFTVKSSAQTLTGGGAISSQTRRGDSYAGYIVLVKADGHIIAKDSNSSRFLKEEWLNRCGRGW